jgi:hypothetical protein
MMKSSRGWSVLLLATLSCSVSAEVKQSASEGDAGDQASGVGNAPQSYGPRWPAIDATQACTYGLEIAAGLCVSTATGTKGLYQLCAVSPDGTWFYENVSTDVHLTAAAGWTFGPTWLANLLGITAMAPSQDSACEAIVEGTGARSLPDCSDGGIADSASGDGSSEQ